MIFAGDAASDGSDVCDDVCGVGNEGNGDDDGSEFATSDSSDGRGTMNSYASLSSSEKV